MGTGNCEYLSGGEQPDIYTGVLNEYREVAESVDGYLRSFEELPLELQVSTAELVIGIKSTPEKQLQKVLEQGDIPYVNEQQGVFNAIWQFYGGDMKKALGTWNQCVVKEISPRYAYIPPRNYDSL